MKRIKISLLGRIVIAILLGLALGRLMPQLLPLTVSTFVTRLFLTLNAIFSQFLGFMIPLIILALVAEAIGSIGNKAGKILLLTVGIAYGSTVFSGYLAYLTGSAVFPHLISIDAPMQGAAKAQELAPFFTVAMPPVMGVMTALVLAFVLGLGATKIHSKSLMAVIVDVKEIISYFIAQVIIPLLPLYIFGVFLGMASNDEVLNPYLRQGDWGHLRPAHLPHGTPVHHSRAHIEEEPLPPARQYAPRLLHSSRDSLLSSDDPRDSGTDEEEWGIGRGQLLRDPPLRYDPPLR